MTDSNLPVPTSGEVLLYQTEDGTTRIEVQLVNETVWLSQAQIADLFQRDRTVITKHIGNIFEEGELVQNSVCAKFAHTAADGKTYQVDYYNLRCNYFSGLPRKIASRYAIPHLGNATVA